LAGRILPDITGITGWSLTIGAAHSGEWKELPMDVRLVMAIVVILAMAVVAGFAHRRRRSDRLRARFGPEYERTVDETGNVRKAEAALEARANRVATFHIRPLAPLDAEQFSTAWRAVEQRFVDDPKAAVTEADRLVGEVMQKRGYPLGDFDQRAADISVDHAGVVVNYRAAREIALRHAKGQATTEDLRQAMIHYRALFQDLLETAPVPPPATAAERPIERESELARRR
jgi:hypothetical protein